MNKLKERKQEEEGCRDKGEKEQSREKHLCTLTTSHRFSQN